MMNVTVEHTCITKYIVYARVFEFVRESDAIIKNCTSLYNMYTRHIDVHIPNHLPTYHLTSTYPHTYHVTSTYHHTYHLTSTYHHTSTYPYLRST